MDLSRIRRAASRSSETTTAGIAHAAEGASGSAKDATEEHCFRQFFLAVGTATIVARAASEEQ